MTHETKTPREEALEIFRLWRKERGMTLKTIIGVTLTEEAVFDIIEAALSTPEAVEEGSAIEALESAIASHEKGELGGWELQLIKSRLYAQGRTQAVPDGWKMVPIEPTDDMIWAGHSALSDGSLGQAEIDDGKIAYKAMLSAAPFPPVTGGAWQPIDSAPKDGTRVLLHMTGGKQCVARTEHHPFGGPMWVVYGEMGKPDCWCLATEDEETTPTYWQPLPAPPSSAEEV